MQPKRRALAGWLFAVTGFLACPCHLVIALPLTVAFLGGTALGGWIATHEGAIAVGASLYFVGALALGALLLLVPANGPASGNGPESGAECGGCTCRRVATWDGQT